MSWPDKKSLDFSSMLKFLNNLRNYFTDSSTIGQRAIQIERCKHNFLGNSKAPLSSRGHELTGNFRPAQNGKGSPACASMVEVKEETLSECT